MQGDDHRRHAVIRTRYCDAVSYDDRVTTSSVRPVFLRDGAGIEDPLRAVHAFLKAPGRFDVSDPSRPASFGAVAGGLDGLPGLPELLLGLLRADGDHEVVDQVR